MEPNGSHHNQKIPLFGPILSYLNPANTITNFSFKIHFNIINTIGPTTHIITPLFQIYRNMVFIAWKIFHKQQKTN